MKILIACEYSGIVRDAFADKGHNVMSCDLLPTESTKSGGAHYEGDVFDIIGHHRHIDMMIAFPPCTYLTVTANRSFLNNPERWRKRLEALIFVSNLMGVEIPRICIENPVGVISTHIRKPEQYIQPNEFGHPDSKKTCLWLKNLPKLNKPTNIVDVEWVYPKNGSGKRMSKSHASTPSTNNPENSKIRSRTYKGIALAMADQWGDLPEIQTLRRFNIKKPKEKLNG